MAYPQSCCTACSDTELVQIPGIAGDDGADGADGASAYTLTTADFDIPALNTTVDVTVASNAWMAVGQYVLCSDGTDVGTFIITALTGTTAFTGRFVSASGDSAVGSTVGSGASVVAAGAPGTGLAGAADPEGAVYGSPGMTYLNTTDESVWFKKTGQNSTTGWIEVIACFILMLSLFAAQGAPPIVRAQYTTNYFTNANVYITNLVGWMNTNNAAFTNQSLVRSRWAAVNDAQTYTNIIAKQHTNGVTGNIHLLSATGLPWALMVNKGTMTNSYATNAPVGWTGVQYIVDALDATTNQYWYTNGILYVTNRYVF